MLMVRRIGWSAPTNYHPTSEDFQEAAYRVNPKTFCKNLGTSEDGRHCGGGWIVEVSPDPINICIELPQWWREFNDAPERTAAEVSSALLFLSQYPEEWK